MGQLLRRAEDVYGASVEDATLLLNAATGRYHSLNSVAARIWDLLAEPIAEEDLVARLIEEFEVTPEDCRYAVVTFLTALRDRRLVVTC